MCRLASLGHCYSRDTTTKCRVIVINFISLTFSVLNGAVFIVLRSFCGRVGAPDDLRRSFNSPVGFISTRTLSKLERDEAPVAMVPAGSGHLRVMLLKPVSDWSAGSARTHGLTMMLLLSRTQKEETSGGTLVRGKGEFNVTEKLSLSVFRGDIFYGSG